MAIKEIYNYGDSVKARLLNISRRNGQSYQMLVTRYLQERLLYRLSISRFYDHFFLKGGALLYVHERFWRGQHWILTSWGITSTITKKI